MRLNRISWLLFALALPTAAFANTVYFSGQDGTLAGSSAELTLTGSTLVFSQQSSAMVALTVDIGKGYFPVSSTLSGGHIDFKGERSGLRMSAPEPKSISLFGIGLISIVGLLRYRSNREKEVALCLGVCCRLERGR